MIDLKNTKIKLVPKADQVKYLKEKGYIFEKGEEIEVPLIDISPNSHIHIEAPCEICNDIKHPEYRSYLKAINRDGFYCCNKCAGLKTSIRFNNYSNEEKKEILQKTKHTNLKRYGYKSTFQVPQFKDKIKQTNMIKYNCVNPSQSEAIKEKVRLTNMKKYGVSYFSQTQEFKDKVRQSNMEKFGGPAPIYSPEVKNKMISTNIAKYGVPYSSQNEEVRNKYLTTIYKNGTFKTSTQQEYLAELFKLQSNYIIKRYIVDLFDENNQVITEYDGGGHTLAVKLNYISEEDFQRNEMIREKELRKMGYKIIRIKSDKDILPTDEMLCLMYSCALKYFKETSHTWITYNLDNSTIKNAINPNGTPYMFGELFPITSDRRNHNFILLN